MIKNVVGLDCRACRAVFAESARVVKSKLSILVGLGRVVGGELAVWLCLVGVVEVRIKLTALVLKCVI
jgi:hypothetical protein